MEPASSIELAETISTLLGGLRDIKSVTVGPYDEDAETSTLDVETESGTEFTVTIR